MDQPPAVDDEWRKLPPPVAVSLPSPRRRAGPTAFRRLLNGSSTAPPPPPPSSWLEIRLFYVRISPCAVDDVPPLLTLSHPRREIGAAVEINGARVPAAEPTSVPLRRDRLDRDAAEVTYVSTDGVRIAGAVDFEVSDDEGNLILCGSLERMETPWSNGVIGSDQHQDKDAKTGWSMDCYLAASVGASSFVQPNLGILSPSIEVYVAGCFAGLPVILTQTVQFNSRRKASKPAILDSIPEVEENTSHMGHGNNDSLVHRRTLSSVAEDEADEYNSDVDVRYSYYPEGWYSDEDGQLSWFNAGVRVGVGIGLGMCVGIGIGVGLLMRSYQATTRNFKRRFF